MKQSQRDIITSELNSAKMEIAWDSNSGLSTGTNNSYMVSSAVVIAFWQGPNSAPMLSKNLTISWFVYFVVALNARCSTIWATPRWSSSSKTELPMNQKACQPHVAHFSTSSSKFMNFNRSNQSWINTLENRLTITNSTENDHLSKTQIRANTIHKNRNQDYYAYYPTLTARARAALILGLEFRRT